MKKVIDTIKEIINKDALTQTEPVTIIENEENITKEEDQQLGDLKLKRDEYAVEIRKAKRGEELSKIRNELLLGQDHLEEQIKLKEELEEKQQIKPDASFYDKCKSYVAQVYPKEIDSSDFYSGIEGTLVLPLDEYPSYNLIGFMKLVKNIFVDTLDLDNSEYTEEVRDEFTLQVAGVCAVCSDNITYINDLEKEDNTLVNTDFLRKNIKECLTEVTTQELAGEVFGFLDNIN